MESSFLPRYLPSSPAVNGGPAAQSDEVKPITAMRNSTMASFENAPISDAFSEPASSSRAHVSDEALGGPQSVFISARPSLGHPSTGSASDKQSIIFKIDAGGPYSMDPFLDTTQTVSPTTFGVLKIKNIPYDVTRQEIVHFLGRSPNVIESHTMGCPIHIIMERPTSKTMDCFVEFQDLASVRDQIRRHENLVESGRHPKLGSRHVHIEEADQNELLREMFPRAKSLVWQNSSPEVITNEDPYSTGFKGFFTKEEMVGLVRHAECPQRSPFSINCLQRTFECMISTLYKFPWYAAEMYTVADRNLLFSTYMQQMQILVEKVEKTSTKGLEQNLLRDFIFAGMNCPGFGERQKHTLVTAAGYWGGGVPVSPLSCAWPFDLLGRKPGLDDQTVKHYLEIIDRGVEALHDSLTIRQYFIVSARQSVSTPIDSPHFLNNTRFQLNEEAQYLDCGTAMTIEMRFMQDLLVAGQGVTKQQPVYPRAEHLYPQQEAFTGNQGHLAENMRMLHLQRDQVHRDSFESHPGRALNSPPQSPKGTTAIIPDPYDEANRTPTRKSSKPIDPTSKPFEPMRRQSAPQQLHGLLGDGLFFGRLGSSSTSLATVSDFPIAPNSRVRADYTTPVRTKSKTRFSVDQTIHEEDDEDLVMGTAFGQNTC